MIDFDLRLRLASQIAEMLQSYAGTFGTLIEVLAQGDTLISVNRLPVPADLAVAVCSLLAEANAVERVGNDPLQAQSERVYRVRDSDCSSRLMQDAQIISALSVPQDEVNILRTWPFSDPLPGHLAQQSRDLDLRYVSLLASATKHALVVTPFLNTAAAERLAPSIETAIADGARVDLIAYMAHQPGSARSAIICLRDRIVDHLGSRRAEQFTAFSNEQDNIMVHAKLLLIDGRTGYLGSANTTSQGFAKHLEVGVELNPRQTRVLTAIILRVIRMDYVVPVRV